jgi:hypothetical protein
MAATPPNNGWSCQKCLASNNAGADQCCGCGAPMFEDILPVGGEMIAKSWMLFFPEIIPAVVVAAISPIWLLFLLAAGKFGAALALAGGMGACICGFVFAARDGQKWIAYVCMVGVLGTAFLVADTAGH